MSHPDVFKAMEDASKAFVSIPVLPHWVGKRIAEAFGAEAGLPTAGAVNALILAVASCILKGTELEDHDPLEPPGWDHRARARAALGLFMERDDDVYYRALEEKTRRSQPAALNGAPGGSRTRGQQLTRLPLCH